MATNRRLWLKQISLGLEAIGLANFKVIASPGKQEFFEKIGGKVSPVFLGSNENPYGPSPLARKAFTNNITISNRYNWDIASQLISAIAEKNRVNDENILLGAGSTEILDLGARYVASEKGNYYYRASFLRLLDNGIGQFRFKKDQNSPDNRQEIRLKSNAEFNNTRHKTHLYL